METSWVAPALAARPDVDGISAASELRQIPPSCRMLIPTMYGRPRFVHRPMEGGFAGFLLKDAPVEVLAAAIRRCAAGEDVSGMAPACDQAQLVSPRCQ